jgi:hypothetical protein
LLKNNKVSILSPGIWRLLAFVTCCFSSLSARLVTPLSFHKRSWLLFQAGNWVFAVFAQMTVYVTKWALTMPRFGRQICSMAGAFG